MKTKLMELLENMDAEDLRSVSNEYNEVVCCYDDEIYRMDEFDDVCQGWTPTDIAKKILGEDFSLDDDYFVFTIYGIESFSRFNLINHVDIEEVVEYIIENENCLGNSDVDNILKGWRIEMNYNINIEDFAKQFNKEYEFLYDNNNNVAGYKEAVETFDKLLDTNESFQKLVGEYANYIGDFISSDREACAFIFALETFM